MIAGATPGFPGFFLRRGKRGLFVSETMGQMGTKQAVMTSASPKFRAASAAIDEAAYRMRANPALKLKDVADAVNDAVARHGYRALFCAADMRMADRIVVLPAKKEV